MSDCAERLRDTLAVLDVGHGSSAVLFSGDDVAVFDAGPGPGLLAFARGRSDRACCGGTILIPLRDPHRITPDSAGHLAFIGKAAQSPLCR